MLVNWGLNENPEDESDPNGLNDIRLVSDFRGLDSPVCCVMGSVVCFVGLGWFLTDGTGVD